MKSDWLSKHWKSLLIVAALAAVATGAVVTKERWLPRDGSWISLGNPTSPPADHAADHPHPPGDEHDHPDDHPEEPESIVLSPAAQKNIQLRTEKMALRTFVRTVSLPGIVVERPGRSLRDINAPMTGVVTQVYPIAGEAIMPGQRLFEIRMTHEDLVASQREFLRFVEELEVVKKEIARLESAGEGFVAGKAILERKFEQQKIEAGLRAQEQGLLLHGLTREHVESIVKTRNLVQSLVISAPEHEHTSEHCDTDHLFHVQQLNVKPGQHVETGASLCVIADHCELFIEGTGFEQDLDELNRAMAEQETVSAILTGGDGGEIPDLKLLYMADRVESDSRALHFYVRLPNEAVRITEVDGHRFIAWKFRPGQRMQVRVPIERWTDRIVLPIGAIAQDGPESYVFRVIGNRFERRPVHIEYRDAESAVIANDGTLRPGTSVVVAGAQQLQIAIQTQSSGGGGHSHAGHTH